MKLVGYAGLVGGTVVAFGGVMYTLYKELTETTGTYALVQRAVDRIEQDSAVQSIVGP